MEDLIKLLDIKHLLVCSFVSWGVVQALKPVCKNKLPKHFSDAVLRISAILIGCGVGFAMDASVQGAGVGAACGTMSTFTVALVKRVVSSKAKVDLKEIEGEPAEEDSTEDA